MVTLLQVPCVGAPAGCQRIAKITEEQAAIVRACGGPVEDGSGDHALVPIGGWRFTMMEGKLTWICPDHLPELADLPRESVPLTVPGCAQ
jgi:hypothetical protein